jgi:hypothetical protein
MVFDTVEDRDGDRAEGAGAVTEDKAVMGAA